MIYKGNNEFRVAKSQIYLGNVGQKALFSTFIGGEVSRRVAVDAVMRPGFLPVRLS